MAGKLATHQEIADLAGTEVDYPYKGNKMIVTEEYNQSTPLIVEVNIIKQGH